jgi:hypothetical protein
MMMGLKKMPENRSRTEGLLVRAEAISQRLVHVVRTMDGALLLDADPAWACSINKVLVSKGVKVSELSAWQPESTAA